jgi:Xaa-Pro dipeptidase
LEQKLTLRHFIAEGECTMTLDPVRDARNREIMAVHGLDALVCRLPENVLLLTGYWPVSSFAFAVVPREGEVVLIAADTERLEIPDGAADEVRYFRSAVLGALHPLDAIGRHLGEIFRTMGVQAGRIGIEQHFEVVAAGHSGGDVFIPGAATQEVIASAAPDATLIDAIPLLDAARSCKTPYELDKLRRANAVAALGLQAFHDWYEAGRTEAEVAAQVEAAIRGHGIGFEGAHHVRAWAQVMSGPGSSLAYSLHPTTSDRVVQAGDLGVLELGTSVDGYWSDLTRTFVAGPPSERQNELYGAILSAVDAVIDGALPGMTALEVDALARSEIERRGFMDFFFHPTGHGLGFRYHEPHPLLKPWNEEKIQAGMVSSVEPGLYIEGFGGMRLEQNVVFTDERVELLSLFPTALGR